MSVISGKVVVLQVAKGGAFYPIACNASCSMNLERDMIETTFRDSGDIRSFVPGKGIIVLNGSGAIEFEAGYSPADVMDAWFAGTLIQWEFILTDNKIHASIVKTYSGVGYFRTVDLTGDVQQAANCDYVIQVSGPITGTSSGGGATVQLRNYTYTATGGETTISYAEWVNADMLLVERNGIGLEIITSGTPTGNQVLHDAVAGTLTFNSGLPLGTDEYINTLYES